MSLMVATALLLPGSVYSQPTKAQPAKAVKVTKVTPPAKVIVTAPASMSYVVVKAPPASQPAVAKAVPALQPASQPTVKVPATFWPWLQANGSWFIPLLIFVLSSIVTVLSKYPRAKGLVAALRMFMGGLSLLEFKDGKRPGLALKWPVSSPLPPPEPPKES